MHDYIIRMLQILCREGTLALWSCLVNDDIFMRGGLNLSGERQQCKLRPPRCHLMIDIPVIYLPLFLFCFELVYIPRLATRCILRTD